MRCNNDFAWPPLVLGPPLVPVGRYGAAPVCKPVAVYRYPGGLGVVRDAVSVGGQVWVACDVGLVVMASSGGFTLALDASAPWVGPMTALAVRRATPTQVPFSTGAFTGTLTGARALWALALGGWKLGVLVSPVPFRLLRATTTSCGSSTMPQSCWIHGAWCVSRPLSAALHSWPPPPPTLSLMTTFFILWYSSALQPSFCPCSRWEWVTNVSMQAGGATAGPVTALYVFASCAGVVFASCAGAVSMSLHAQCQ